MCKDKKTRDAQYRSSRSVQFHLPFAFLVMSGAAIVFALGRSLGVQFVLYMIGVIGLLVFPAIFQTYGANRLKTMGLVLVALFWLLGWILMASWGLSRPDK